MKLYKITDPVSRGHKMQLAKYFAHRDCFHPYATFYMQFLELKKPSYSGIAKNFFVAYEWFLLLELQNF